MQIFTRAAAARGSGRPALRVPSLMSQAYSIIVHFLRYCVDICQYFVCDCAGDVAAMTTTPRLLTARAAAEPDRTALIVDGVDSLTFGAWHARSNAAAHAILRRGLPPGGRVGLLFDARGWVDYAVCFAAVHKAGGVAVPLPRTQPAGRTRPAARRLRRERRHPRRHCRLRRHHSGAVSRRAAGRRRGPRPRPSSPRRIPAPILARSTSRSARRIWRRSSTPPAPPAAPRASPPPTPT